MITILYSCKKCAKRHELKEHGLCFERAYVRERLVSESFSQWLENEVYRAIDLSHRFYKPYCLSHTIDFYLPNEARVKTLPLGLVS